MKTTILLLLLLTGCATTFEGNRHCHGPTMPGYIVGNIAFGLVAGSVGGYGYAAGAAGSADKFSDGDIAIGVTTGVLLAVEPLVIDALTGSWNECTP